MTAFEANVSNKVHELTRSWYRSGIALERAQKALEAAQKEHEVAKRTLGDFMCPNNPTPVQGEKFNIWYGSGMLSVQFITRTTEGAQYHIGWRQEPSVKQLSDMA
jgi:hypothetical protein